MYEKIEAELRGVQYALHSSLVVSTTPLPSEETKLDLGDEPTQVHRIDDVTKSHLRRAQKETEQATVSLKQAQEEVIYQHRIAHQEKDALQENFEEEKVQIHHEKEQLLMEQVFKDKFVSADTDQSPQIHLDLEQTVTEYYSFPRSSY
jgi:hypothetical protein